MQARHAYVGFACLAQSLVMNAWPYHNEPSYEGMAGRPRGRLTCAAYNAEVRFDPPSEPCSALSAPPLRAAPLPPPPQVRLATLRHAMTHVLRSPPAGMERAVRAHFFLKRDEIRAQAAQWAEEAVLLARYQLEALRLRHMDVPGLLRLVKVRLRCCLPVGARCHGPWHGGALGVHHAPLLPRLPPGATRGAQGSRKRGAPERASHNVPRV